MGTRSVSATSIYPWECFLYPQVRCVYVLSRSVYPRVRSVTRNPREIPVCDFFTHMSELLTCNYTFLECNFCNVYIYAIQKVLKFYFLKCFPTAEHIFFSILNFPSHLLPLLLLLLLPLGHSMGGLPLVDCVHLHQWKANNRYQLVPRNLNERLGPVTRLRDGPVTQVEGTVLSSYCTNATSAPVFQLFKKLNS